MPLQNLIQIVQQPSIPYRLVCSLIIRRIIARTSASIFGLPMLLGRDRNRQKRRKPARCQATTVSGLTTIRAWLHKGQNGRRRIQNARSCLLRRGRGVFLFSTPSCWRRARISRPRLYRERKKAPKQVMKPRKKSIRSPDI